jgi:hypothetical protein
MADFDAGHYFLTLAVPVERSGTTIVDGRARSRLDQLRDTLVALPTAEQDEFSRETGLDSPFARVQGTHFARFFVLDDVRYNGRYPSNPIFNLIFNVKMTVAEKVDQLPHAYLIMTIDFDAMDGTTASLRAYTNDLWRHMSQELSLIFGHCIGFDGVVSEQGFFDFIRRFQLHTTMPFNDYWTDAPPVTNPLPLFGAILICGPVLALAAWTGGLWPWSAWGLAALTIAAVLVLIVGITFRRGLTPFPKAPDSDIASVLKAIYIQQMFVGFMIDNLGRGGRDLYDAFEAFRTTHRPADIEGPTQPSGRLMTRWKPR